MFEVKTYRRAMFDCNGDWWRIWRKTDRLINSDLHFESIMAELNQHKTSKQIDSPLQFGQEENIPGHTIGRVGLGWWILL